jgi:hypothetical protein
MYTYFSLREIDIELMKRLSPRVNVIPVIGKADTCTPTELVEFKKRVCSEFDNLRAFFFVLFILIIFFFKIKNFRSWKILIIIISQFTISHSM